MLRVYKSNYVNWLELVGSFRVALVKFAVELAVNMNKLIFFAVFLSTFFITVKPKLDFSNAVCISLDRPFVYFDQCILKAVNRTYKYFTMRAKFPQKQPVSNISMTFALLRKANGYKPFLYNFTIDACKYLKKRNNPVIRYFHSWFESYSTINKTCPYGVEDAVVEKLPISYVNHVATEVLPLPTGEYAFHTDWYFYGVKRAIVKVFFQIF
ncbi:uncharacterized protein LOC105209789 [Zeugodacus cucurbitae]|uniref:uncharacterized protein LOC105209789 n=1 Tax=Zeugodacus cucurbitae TaxID=28588 RepID=UPI0023D944C5|nr:uncharacterized protein LOC105209789 [Zeugodacus cucurbitae]